MKEEHHCHDCCCARSWEALGVTSYTGVSIVESIEALRARLEKSEHERQEVIKANEYWHTRVLQMKQDLDACIEERR